MENKTPLTIISNCIITTIHYVSITIMCVDVETITDGR